ncbi:MULTISPECIES: Fic family protein [Azospirillum]
MDEAVQSVDVAWAANNQVFSKAEKLYRSVRTVAALFVYFLEVHPYANGNGHMARFILIALLRRYGLFLSRWPIHPRPADPPYSKCIALYRDGHPIHLEKFILNCI